MEDLKPPATKPEVIERVRIYDFGGGDTLRIKDVICVRYLPDGTHQITCSNGSRHRVAPKWLSISVSPTAAWADILYIAESNGWQK